MTGEICCLLEREQKTIRNIIRRLTLYEREEQPPFERWWCRVRGGRGLRVAIETRVLPERLKRKTAGTNGKNFVVSREGGQQTRGLRV